MMALRSDVEQGHKSHRAELTRSLCLGDACVHNRSDWPADGRPTWYSLGTITLHHRGTREQVTQMKEALTVVRRSNTRRGDGQEKHLPGNQPWSGSQPWRLARLFWDTDSR
jgi:hypothetical protein